MNRPILRRLLIGLAAAPLALALAACGGKDAGSAAAPSGEPIAKIAAPAGTSWAETIATTEDGGYRMGNPEAPIKVIEFGSLTCSHCADFAELSEPELRDTFVASGRVSFEFRNFVRDAIDVTAAQLTRCGTPESYFALTAQTFAFQPSILENVQKAGDQAFAAAMQQPAQQRGVAIAQIAGLLDFFAARGISRDQAAACLADTEQTQELARRTEKQGAQYDIKGTPTFIVNGAKVDMNTWPDLKAHLEKLGAR